MTDKTYKCDFCRRTINAVIGESKDAGYAVEWVRGPGDRCSLCSLRLLDHISKSDIHLCQVCISAIKLMPVPF